MPNTSKTPSKPVAKEELKKPVTATAATEEVVKKKPGRPPKAATAGAAPATGAKRGRKPKAGNDAPSSDIDMSDI
ncbi:MAG: hypothetical protein EON92_05310, partial [Burkholderiales bacterium]